MTKLISIDDFKAIRPISSNVDSLNRLDPYIIEAQRFDLRDVLGEELLHDLLENYLDAPYVDLLKGKSYTDTHGKNFEFDGLKTVIAYYAYARFILNDNVRSTASGFMTKRNEFSDQITDKALTRMATAARNSAAEYFSDVTKYMETFPADFPLWKGNCTTNGNAKTGFVVKEVSPNTERFYDPLTKTYYEA